MASSSKFVEKVERLLVSRQLYLDTDDLATQAGLLMGRDKDLALDLIKRMANLARSKEVHGRVRSKDYLKKLSRSLDTLQLMSSSWINQNVATLPTPKKKKEQVYDHQRKIVDIRTLDNPDLPVHHHVLTRDEDGQSDMDIGPDPDISLGSPVASPARPVTVTPRSPVCTVTSESGLRPSSSAVREDDGSDGVRQVILEPSSIAVSMERYGSDTDGVRQVILEPSSIAVSMEKYGSDTDGVRQVILESPSIAVSMEENPIPTTGNRERQVGILSSVKRQHSPSPPSRSVHRTVTYCPADSSKEKKNRPVDSVDSSKRKDHRQRNTACVVWHCEEEGRGYPKMHAFNFHIPGIFDMRLPSNDPRILNLRVQALSQAAEWLMGSPRDFEGLMELVNLERFIDKREDHFPSLIKEAVIALSRFLNLPLPRELSICPVNCVAALLHWRCLLVIISLLRRNQHDSWREMFPTPDLSALPAAPSNVSIPRAFDSHFHLDRLQDASGLYNTPLTEIMNAGTVADGRQVQVVGGVANFCDPESYPTSRQLDDFPSDLVITIGFHPKYAIRSERRLSTELERMQRLLHHPRVAGIGEIGIDHSVSDDQWHWQNDLLRRMISYVKPHHVVVIHCRGIPHDNGVEAHFLLLNLLKELPRTQRIQVHSFSGCAMVLQQWISQFPEAVFSFNRGILDTPVTQLEALTMLEDKRLLLETDAPHFKPRGERFSAPNQLYDVAEFVARHRQSTVQEILELSRRNGLRFYNKE